MESSQPRYSNQYHNNCSREQSSSNRRERPKYSPKTRKQIEEANGQRENDGNQKTHRPKWYEINQMMMREKQIGILLVQEAHMNEERRERVEGLFKKNLKIYHSEDPENPTRKGGVVIVLNRVAGKIFH
ncbi:hypothetical protein B0H14DRAFT_2560684 [Mycena olivaceomarginata]|nr:hypothetical protein B0H14DRAFT_2560684 [Mycena olivaceomarginata]